PAREPSASPTARSLRWRPRATRWSARSAPATSTPTSVPSGRSATPATPAPTGRAFCARSRISGSASSATSFTSAATRRLSRRSGVGRTPCSRPAGRGTARPPRKRPAMLSSGFSRNCSECWAIRRRLRPDELTPRLPELRAARRERVQLCRRGDGTPERVAHAPRVDELHLLSPQRRRSAARVVVPPPRLRDLVPGRARHEDERGDPHGDLRPDAAGGPRRMRLPARPGERLDRTREVTFSFYGKPVRAFEGDTFGSALYASGQRVFSRS